MTESIALRYDSVEDRLALTISRDEAAPRDLHLTRRSVRSLAAALTRMANETAQAPEASDEDQRKRLAALHHGAMADQVPIQSARKPRRAVSDGVRPLLVVGIRSGRTRSSPVRWVLEFGCEGDEKFKLTLSTKMLHGFIELLRRRLAATDWGIELLAAPEGEGRRLRMH